MYVFCLHAIYMHHISVWCSGRKSNPLGLEVTDGCGPLWGHQKSHQGSSVRVISILLTAGLSLQALRIIN